MSNAPIPAPEAHAALLAAGWRLLALRHAAAHFTRGPEHCVLFHDSALHERPNLAHVNVCGTLYCPTDLLDGRLAAVDAPRMLGGAS